MGFDLLSGVSDVIKNVGNDVNKVVNDVGASLDKAVKNPGNAVKDIVTAAPGLILDNALMGIHYPVQVAGRAASGLAHIAGWKDGETIANEVVKADNALLAEPIKDPIDSTLVGVGTAAAVFGFAPGVGVAIGAGTKLVAGAATELAQPEHDSVLHDNGTTDIDRAVAAAKAAAAGKQQKAAAKPSWWQRFKGWLGKEFHRGGKKK